MISQDRGSSVEGIWIIKLESGSYYKSLGDLVCADDEELVLVEACGYNAETRTGDKFMRLHTVGEFMKLNTVDEFMKLNTDDLMKLHTVCELLQLRVHGASHGHQWTIIAA